MSQYETRRIRVGDHVAVLRAEVSPAGVGRVELTWEGEAPGRMSGAQWVQLREAKAKILARLVGIYGTQEPRAQAQAPTPRPPRNRAPAALLASQRGIPVQARLPLYGEGIATLADDLPDEGKP